ncbi:MAG: phosphoserine phosphatase SerB [Epsilonproteobacteria bacterium]|nr:MAG: phosphoserine phosphatase SerB [Campylobacterota bacterium]
MNLAVFDFDSTLMDGETIDMLGFAHGVGEGITAITTNAMAGEIDFFESLISRVKLLEGMPYDQAVAVCQNLPYIKGAKTMIQNLKQKNYKVVCMSGGFTIATHYAQNILGFDIEFANTLHHKNGTLTGEVGGEMMFEFSKGDMIHRLQKLLDIPKKRTLCIGDGANDLSMFKHSGTKIAFCAKEVLKNEADIVIDEKDLNKVLAFV